MQSLTSAFLAIAVLHVISVAIADDELMSPRYQAMAERYEANRDLAWAYRLAWISAIEDRPDLVHDWLAVLANGGWRMGVDTSRIRIADQNQSTTALIDNLQAATGTGRRSSQQVFVLDDAELIPESIAYDASARILYSGSLHKKKVVAYVFAVGGKTARVYDVDTDSLGAVYGIKFDPAGGELWVPHNQRVDGELYGKLSVFKSDGTPIREYVSELSGPSELNDLCIGEDSVYVTDSMNDALLRGFKTGETLHSYIDSPNLPYANGVACDGESENIFVAGATGIYRIDQSNPGNFDMLDVPPGYSLGGIDGLYLHAGRLVGIQNALGAPKVVVGNLVGSNRINGIRFYDVLSPDFRIPTTGFIHGDCFYYIANSSLDALGPNEQLDPAAPAPEVARILGLSLDTSANDCNL